MSTLSTSFPGQCLKGAKQTRNAFPQTYQTELQTDNAKTAKSKNHFSSRWHKCLCLIQAVTIGITSAAQEPAKGDLTSIAIADSTGIYLEEVTVSGTGARLRLNNVQAGSERLELTTLAKTPAMFGESDIMKSVMLLPGVRSAGEGTGGIEVRGGNSSQNMALLDDTPLLNPTHIMGIFSSFNDEHFGSATLFKGAMPPRFGGASSSVLNITGHNGDMERFHASATIGLLLAKIHAEGPIAKSRASFSISARRSYVDLFLKVVPKYRSTIMNFYDLNARFCWDVSESDRLTLSGFRGEDRLGIGSLMFLNWGNTTANLSWIHRGSGPVAWTTSLSYAGYETDMWANIVNSSQSMLGYVRRGILKHTMSVTLNEWLTLEGGVQSELSGVKSAEFETNGTRFKETRRGWENAIWINTEGEYQCLSWTAGVRLSSFSALGGSPYYNINDNGTITESTFYSKGDFVRTFLSVEPRISLNFRVANDHRIKAAYSLTGQNLHDLRSPTIWMPADRFILSSNIIEPERCNQVSLGWTGILFNGGWEFSVEGYLKAIDNIYDYRNGKSWTSEIELERLILGGKGRSWGLEFMARKEVGRLTGWVSYTLSRTENRIPGINDNHWYAATNDRCHDVAVVAMLDLGHDWDLSSSWTYQTGRPMTLPSAKYEISGSTCYYYPERNGYRTPANHRLDVAATHTHKGKRFTRVWSLGFYNLYNRYNPYMIYFEDDDTKPSGTKAVSYSLFGIVPSVSFSLKF